MTVILVNEDNHGLLTVAKDYKSAVKFLIDNRWIKEYTEIWDNEDHLCHLKDAFTKDLFDIMVEDWDIEVFNDFWTGNFYLEEIPIYE